MRANKGMTKIQNSFRFVSFFKIFTWRFEHSNKNIFYFLRQRKRKETEMKERERQRAEVQYQATREHLRRLRQFKLQQIQTIQLLPACK